MNVIVYLAEVDGRLPRSDRTAAGWAAEISAAGAIACLPSSDAAAREYARALGLTAEDWDVAPAPFDLALLGGGAVMRLGDVFAGRLAEVRGASLVFDVLSVRRTAAGWNVVADAGRGARDVIEVTGPLVAVASEDAPRTAYISRHRRGRLSGDRSTGSGTDLPSASDWGPVVARTPRVAATTAKADDRTNAAFGIADRGSSSQGDVFRGTPAECAGVLLRYLRGLGVLSAGPGLAEGRVVPSEGEAAGRDAIARAPASDSHGSGAQLGELPAFIVRSPRYADEPITRVARRPRRVISN
jgi:hypothetical protein